MVQVIPASHDNCSKMLWSPPASVPLTASEQPVRKSNWTNRASRRSKSCVSMYLLQLCQKIQCSTVELSSTQMHTLLNLSSLRTNIHNILSSLTQTYPISHFLTYKPVQILISLYIDKYKLSSSYITIHSILNSSSHNIQCYPPQCTEENDPQRWVHTAGCSDILSPCPSVPPNSHLPQSHWLGRLVVAVMVPDSHDLHKIS